MLLLWISQLLVLFAHANYGYSSNYKHDDGISFNQFKASIESTDTRTLNGALELVPEEFYKNYVLVYRSRSLQQSSFLYPRAIVFGRSARFIMAYNGHPRQKGYNNIEIIQFNEKDQKWDFHEIEFFENNLKPKFKANPKKCMECHQSPKRVGVDMRPNWEPYNFWPGVYASVDDTLKPTLEKEYKKLLDGYKPYGTVAKFNEDDHVLVNEQKQEQAQLAKFEKEIKSQPDSRYRFLGPFKTRDPLNLTKSLVSLNMFRLVRLAKESLGPLYDKYKYALYGLQNASNQSSKNIPFRCNGLYLPDNLKSFHVEKTLTNKSIPEKKYQRPEKSHLSMRWQPDFAASIDIIFNPLGIQTDDWSMDFKTDGRFAFRNRFGSPADSPTHLRDALLEVFPNDPTGQLTCEELEIKSNNVLSEFYESGELEKAFIQGQEQLADRRSRPLINRCIQCHVDYEDPTAPYIPFDNFSLLKDKLIQQKFSNGNLMDEIKYRTGSHAPKHQQMPPAGQVDPVIRKKFIQQLESLIQ